MATSVEKELHHIALQLQDLNKTMKSVQIALETLLNVKEKES